MKSQNKTLFFISCAIYFAAAMFINCFGQASNSMMASLSISQSKQGAILTYEAIGGILIAIYLSLYGENHNKVKTILLGTILLALGTISVFLFSFVENPYTYIFISLMLANAGYTTIDLTINSMICEVYSDNKNKYIPIIHTFYGLGAMAMPSFYLLSTCYTNNNHYAYAYLGLGIITIIITFLLLKQINSKNLDNKVNKKINDPYEIFKTSKAWFLLLAALLFAIFQTGFQSWATDYNLSVLNLSNNYSSIIITSFFAGALVMRYISTYILNKTKNYKYYFICALLAGISLLAAISSKNNIIYSIFLILTGFFQGGLVPTYMIIVTDSFPSRQSSSSAIFVLAIGISNLLSKLYGLIIEIYSYETLMIILGICLILSGLIIYFLSRKQKEDL